jgi:hypothetical protein
MRKLSRPTASTAYSTNWLTNNQAKTPESTNPHYADLSCRSGATVRSLLPPPAPGPRPRTKGPQPPALGKAPSAINRASVSGVGAPCALRLNSWMLRPNSITQFWGMNRYKGLSASKCQGDLGGASLGNTTRRCASGGRGCFATNRSGRHRRCDTPPATDYRFLCGFTVSFNDQKLIGE